jgi:NADPH:quinone reductase-like Zn-dependent oxidoreductase
VKAYFTNVVNGESRLVAKDIDIPKPADDEILIKVKATALNRGGFIVGGVMHGSSAYPSGTDAAGEIVRVGSRVQKYKPGDKIMGRVIGTNSGSYSEYCTIKDYQTMFVPSGFSWEESAAIPVSYLAAYDALITYGKLSKNDIVLITSISSAIGASALIISKIIGAKVIGTSTSKLKLEKLLNYGMDFGIATPETNLVNKIKEFTEDGISLVVNCLGGSIFNDAMKTLKFKGIFVNVGYMDSITNVEVNLKEIHAQRYSIHGISNAYITRKDIIKTVEGFKKNILPYLGKNKEKPIIDKIYDFDDIDKAREYMMANNQIGKIVVKL